jgi:geranylgeranyl reductase family protein
MNYEYDVAIVGGGPIGSTLAYELSKCSLSVCILDKKKKIGVPLQCAGIISKEIKKVNEIPDDVILNEVKGAFIYSPNHSLEVSKEETEAFIIDRISYDQFLSKRAVESGVKLLNNHKVIDADIENGILFCDNNEKIRAKIIVGADGYNSIISKTFNNESKSFNASQFLVKINNSYDDHSDFYNQNKDFVELHLDSEILPGFLWCIPTSFNEFRVGLFSNKSFKNQKEILESFLDKNHRFKDYKIIERYHGNIPIYDKNKKIVCKKAILIGDAGSQVKPTTGGGLIMGFKTVEIAKIAILDGLNNDLSHLKNYSLNFKKKYYNEINYQLKVHKTIDGLSNNDLDYIFLKLKEKGVEDLISKYGDMDKQSTLVKEVLKRGLLLSIMPKLLFNRIFKIWSLKKK